MRTKSYVLKVLALVLAMIILISNFSFVFASTITTEDLQKSLQKYFDTRIIVKGSDSSKTVHSPMGDYVSITDSSIKLINPQTKETLFDTTYSIEDNKIKFITDFTEFNNEMQEEYIKNGMKIDKETKISIALVLSVFYSEMLPVEFLSASNLLNINSNYAYTSLRQNVLDKMYDVSDEEEINLKNININTDLATLQLNVEDNVYTNAAFTINLDKLANLSENDIDSKGTIYSVYYSSLPDEEKDNIADFKDWVEVKSKYTYTGKNIKPYIIMGKLLEEGIDYKVSYSNNKKIGKATIKVTGIGDYKGSFTKTFNIVPKGTTISKIKKTTNTINVKWKKQTTQTKGYQIQYSTNKNFNTGNKKVTITNNKTTSKKISKLKENKNYYVRIRTYKTVKGTKYYSSWSKAKTVRTKSSNEKVVKKFIENNFKKEYGNKVIKKVKFNKVHIYNKSEIKKDSSLKGYKIGSKDIVFRINYEIKLAANYKNKDAFTAGTGEIKGNWVKNKSNVGILKYKAKAYKLKAFGTGF